MQIQRLQQEPRKEELLLVGGERSQYRWLCPRLVRVPGERASLRIGVDGWSFGP